jgi:hypothetical protein
MTGGEIFTFSYDNLRREYSRKKEEEETTEPVGEQYNAYHGCIETSCSSALPLQYLVLLALASICVGVIAAYKP